VTIFFLLVVFIFDQQDYTINYLQIVLVQRFLVFLVIFVNR